MAGWIFLAVLLLAVPQAALLPLLDRDEPRFAEASREMLQSGDFIVPTFDGAARYAKPPLIYWTQVASFTLFGENAFAARLPSLLATAGTAALLLAWGAETGAGGLGLIAALAYALCFQTMQQGRVATADALLVFFTTFTVFAGWKLLAKSEPGSRAWNAWGALLALGFAGGFLAKGPEALLPIFPLLYLARKDGTRIVLAVLAIFLLGLLLVAAWGLPAFIQTHGDYWREGLGHDVGDRMIRGFQGHGAGSLGGYLLLLPFYFFLFWLSALPWSPLLVIHRRRLFAAWRLDELDRYLLLNAALYFVIFSLMVTKLPHYTLPAFPLLALLFARRWLAAGFPPGLPVKLAWSWGILWAVLALVFIPLAVMPYANPSPTGRLVRAAGAALRPDTTFALVDFQEPNAIWEMRRVVRGYSRILPDDRSAVLAFLAGPGPRAVLLSTAAWGKIEPGAPASCRTFSAQGWNAGRVARVNLTLVLNRPE